MCSCCDPTAASPAPVVKRLEREVELKSQDLMKLQKAMVEALAEIDRLANEITAYNDRLNAIPTMCQPPQTVEDGLRFLAVWFDAMYPNDPDTQVQDDCRRWAVEIESLRTDNSRLRGLLEPCRPDTDAQTDPAYPKTVDDVLSLLSAYIADFLPDDVCPGDEYFGAWERQARRVIQPIMQQLADTQEQLRQQTKSFCTHCGKLFPKGKEGLARFWAHIAECNSHPLHPLAAKLADSEARNRTSLEVIAAREQRMESQRVELERLRGLLREACDVWKESHMYSHETSLKLIPVSRAWYDKAKAALEKSP